ncbi:MAG: carbohydrate-binding family 9-like protein [Bacteroidota bacterium]
MIKLIILQMLLIPFIATGESLYEGSSDKKSGDTAIIITKCEDFEVSGDGSAESWNKTEWINIPQRVEKPDIYTTRAKVLYSETGIYFLFECEDKILTTTMKEDYLNLYEEDVVEVFLWTEEDFPLYFEYEISPLNYELPIMIPNYNGNFFGWLPWHYEGDRKTTHATSSIGGKKKPGASVEAWLAEFFIPYKLLAPLPQVPPKPGTKWRANMYRIDYDQGQTPFSWQKTSGSFHEYDKFGTFIFE